MNEHLVLHARIIILSIRQDVRDKMGVAFTTNLYTMIVEIDRRKFI